MVLAFINRCVIAGCLSQLLVSAVVASQITSGKGEIAAVLHLDASVALAGTVNGGLYRSVDQGLNWVRVLGIPLCSVKAFAKASASQAFAATDCGLFKSTDSGNTWAAVSNQPSSAVAVAPTSTSTILMGVPGVGILRSTNGGTLFADASSGLDSTDIRAISFDPSNSSIAYAALFNPDWYPPNAASPLPLGGVFKSTDGGVTWVSFNQPTAGASVLTSRWVTGVAVNSAGTVFAATAPPSNPSVGTIQRYSTGLGGWSGPSTTSPSEASVYGAETVTIDANGTDAWIGSNSLGPYVWVQSNNQLRRQMDGSFTADGEVLNKVNAISTFSGAATLVGVAGLGVYRSSTLSTATGLRGYSPWTAPAVDVQADRALSFARNPTTGDSFISLAGGGVVKATGSSTTYAAFNAGFAHPAGVTNVFATPSVQFIAATTSGDVFLASSGRGVMRSASGTGAWSSLTATSWWATGLAASPTANDVYASEFFLQPNPGAYRISASSTSFVQAGWQSGSGISYVAPSHSGYARVYALAADSAGIGSGTNAAGYVVPTTGGSNTPMVTSHAGFQRLGFYAAADSGSTVLAASLKGLFRSTDSGGNFSRVTSSGLPSSGLVGLAMQGGIFFAATRKGELLCSTDLGSTWQSKLTTNSRAVGLTKDGNNLVMLTDGSGIYAETAVCP